MTALSTVGYTFSQVNIIEIDRFAALTTLAVGEVDADPTGTLLTLKASDTEGGRLGLHPTGTLS